MTKASFLFRLPNACLVAILSEWLDMPSIGKLDTAISSKLHRPQFLKSLQNMRSTSIDLFSDGPHGGFMGGATGDWAGYWWRWLSIREIFVESATIEGSKFHSVLVIPSLRKLKIDYCGKIALPRELGQSCPALRSLALHYGREHDNQIDEQISAFGIICLYWKDLEEFFYSRRVSTDHLRDRERLYEYYETTAVGLLDMLRRCSKLKKVSLTGDTLYGVKLEELHPFDHLLHELHFEGDVGSRVPNTGQAITSLLSKCSNLKSFHYFSSQIAPGDSVEIEKDRLVLNTLYQSCPLLEELSLMCVSRVTLGSFFSRLRLHPTLTHIHNLWVGMSDISESILHDIAGMDTLEQLSLSSCKGLTDAGFAFIAELKLKHLFISEYYYARRGFAPAYDNSMTEASLLSFLGANIGHTLEFFYLSIRSTQRIDADKVATAVASCHNLTSLQLDWGSGDGSVFGLESAQAIATGCPLLTNVCLKLTLLGYEHMATHCAHLKRCESHPTVCTVLKAKYLKYGGVNS